MRLNSISVRGFRSLADVSGIPVGSPTILTGPNDGGKTAVLDALDFLVGGGFKPAAEDFSYIASDADAQEQGSDAKRCDEIEVRGEFTLDEAEQTALLLPEEASIRRVADESATRLEGWVPVPDDERLVVLPRLVPDLKKLAKEVGLTLRSNALKDEVVDALIRFGRENSTKDGWSSLAPAVEERLPRILRFRSAGDPDASVKSVMEQVFRNHAKDETVQGHLDAAREKVEADLRGSAHSLCEHIRSRCPDLQVVDVDPHVSFVPTFGGAPLRMARRSGEHVGLKQSGLGSRQRISLAIWEWSSELLKQNAAEAGGEAPTQTIVVYDEPDTHLDYIQQRKVMDLIRSQSGILDTNVIVATHSMNLIDGVDISDVVNLKVVNHRTEVERLGSDTHDEIDRHLGKIAASLGFRNTVLLNERLFVAVEGESEMSSFPILFTVSQQASLQAAGVALWPCSGNDGAFRFAKYLIDHKRRVALVIDADSRSKKLFKDDKLARDLGADWDRFVMFVGEGQGDELEGLFTDVQWAEVANDVAPRAEPWTSGDLKALRAGSKFGKALERELGVSKPQLLYRVAGLMRDRNDVPPELNAVFDKLAELAAY